MTAIGGGGHGDQVLKALLLAPKNRYKIYGADANPNCAQASLVEKFVTLPMAGDSNYLNTLLNTCKKLDIQVLLHGCEPELLVFSKNRELIEQNGIFLPINESRVIELCSDKIATNARLFELGFHVPRYYKVNSESELDKIDWFPVVVKPSINGGGSANVFIAQNLEELQSLVAYMNCSTISNDYIVQEYVGTPNNEYTVGVLHDMEGRYVNSIAVKRHLDNGLSVRCRVLNRTKRKELGSHLIISSGVSQGDIGRFKEVTSQCREIAEKLGSRGPLNFQCRLVDGNVCVFEINPRYSGTTSLRAMVGFNEPDILIRRHLLHEDIAQDAPYREATILRNLTEIIRSGEAV
ncbi:MAG: ATP-grasp domain-containing protein [Gammaproteobacteria bacterium]